MERGRWDAAQWRRGLQARSALLALATLAAALAVTLLPPRSSASAPAREYTLSAASECVWAPGSLNGTGEGAASLRASAPESVVETHELALGEASAKLTLPESLARFARALGASEVSGRVRALPLDLSGLEPQTLNAAKPEGFPLGLRYEAPLPAEGQAQLTIPQSGTISLGPLYATGKAPESASVAFDTQAAYEKQGEGYVASGKGTALTLSAYNSSGESIMGPIEVDCTAKAASFEIPIVAPPAGLEAPRNASAPTISGEPVEGKTLTAHEGEWSGSAPISFAWRWQRCSSSGESCEYIEAARSSTYKLSHQDVGYTIRAVLAASNEAGTRKATTTQTALVTAAPPKSTAAPTISGEARDGALLSASEGSWEGGAPLSFSYRWERCSATGEGCVPIERAIASTYTPLGADVGHTLKVLVTARNQAGEASAESQATAQIAGLPEGQQEYVVSAPTECVSAPEVLNEKEATSLNIAANGPVSIREGEALSLSAGYASLAVPKDLTRFYYALGVREVRGAVTSWPLDLSGLEASAWNLATAEGFTQGRSFDLPLASESGLSLYLPQTGVFQIGPEKVTGKAGEEATVALSTQAAFETTGEGEYRATGKGIAFRIEGLNSAGEHVVGPLEVVCSQGAGAARVKIASAAPHNTVAPTTSGTPEDGQTLTAGAGEWEGTAPLSYAYYAGRQIDRGVI